MGRRTVIEPKKDQNLAADESQAMLVETFARLVDTYKPNELVDWLWLSFTKHNFFPVRSSSLFQPLSELTTGYRLLDEKQQSKFRNGLALALHYFENVRENDAKHRVLADLLRLTAQTDSAEQSLDSLRRIGVAYVRKRSKGASDVRTALENVVLPEASRHNADERYIEILQLARGIMPQESKANNPTAEPARQPSGLD
jgi:hypothetical protein